MDYNSSLGSYPTSWVNTYLTGLGLSSRTYTQSVFADGVTDKDFIVGYNANAERTYFMIYLMQLQGEQSRNWV